MEALSLLIGQVYDAAVDPALWPSVLLQTCMFAGAERAILIHEDALEPRDSMFYISGPDPEWYQLYLDTYMMINPARLATGSRVQPGDVVLTSDYMSRREYSRTRFSREFLSMRTLIDLATAILDATPTSFTVLGLLRSEEQGFADAEVRRRLALVAPHFRRAVTLGALFEQRKMEADILTRTLDALRAGVFILSDEAEVVHANSSALEMLAGERGFRVGDGKLIPHDVSARAALAEALSAASGGAEALARTDLSILFRTGEESGLIGTLMALDKGERRQLALRHRAVAALCLRETSFAAPVPSPAVAELYGLTRREMTVLTTIIENAGVPETAGILGLSEGTVRSHLKAIFRKTGATRQTDLIKLVAGAASPFQ